MAIILPSGFNITNNEPVDARLTLVDVNAKYALSYANVYEGLIVFQQDNDTVWVLTDTANVANSNGWTQIQIGSIATAVYSGSVQININDLEGAAAFKEPLETSILNLEAVSSSYATTGSNVFSGSQVITGSLTVTGSVNINNIIKLAPVTALPSGEAGMLVVSASYGRTNLYIHDGVEWKSLMTGSI